MTAHRQPVARHGRRQSVLWLMALLLSTSGALRVPGQIGAATAQTNTQAQADVVRADLVLGMPIDDQTLPQILEIFQEREAELLEGERRAAARDAALDEAATAIADQLAELRAAEEKLANTLAMTDEAATADLARLATVYENMKPVDAAALFTEMAPAFAAGFMSMMRPEAAAAIMTQLEPNTAHLISIMLAGRNAGGPMRQ